MPRSTTGEASSVADLSVPELYRYQGAIAELSQQGIAARDLYPFFDETARILQQTLAVDCVALWELLPNRSAFLLSAGQGWPKGVVGSYTIDGSHRSFTGYTLRLNQDRSMSSYEAVVVEDLRVETRFRASPLLHNRHLISGINVVIPTPKGPFGVLGVYSNASRRFTSAEANFLIVVSHILAAAIERQEDEAKLQLLERAVNASQNGILIIDALESSNPIIYANQGFETITGYSRQEAIGRSCRFLQGQDRQQPEIDILRQAIAQGQECNVSLRNYRKDGQLFWNRLHISPVHDNNGCLTHFIGIQTDITDYKQAEAQLRDSEARLQGIVSTISDGLLVVTPTGIIKFVNPAAERLFCRSKVELLEQYFGLPVAQGTATEIELTSPTGQLTMAAMRVVDITWEQAPAFLVSLRDITEQYRVTQALAESEERLEGVLGSIQDVVWSTAAVTREVLYLNPATAEVYGRPVTDFYQDPQLWSALIHPDDRLLMEYGLQSLLEQGHLEIEYRILRPNGEIRWLLRRARVVRDDEGNPLRLDGIDSDITERKLAAEQLHYSATHDTLTHLPNRLFFLNRLEHALQRHRRHPDFNFAVLFLDLDSFKVINDSLGHACGDLLLQEIAQRLKSCLRPEDTLARLGGDEFTMLIEEIHTIQDVVLIAERIHRALFRPLNLHGQEIFTNTSIGIATSHIFYRRPEDILRDADTAMYQAKAKGKACYVVFDQAMHHNAVLRLQRESSLRRALERRELELHYQPIINLDTGQLSSLEALVRWRHPEEGLIMPSHFIDIAEETGLIIPISQWILEEACAQTLALQAELSAWHDLTISVNVSSRHMRNRDLLEDIDRVLALTHLRPQSLKLEITETLLMDNLELATEVLLELRKRDISISLDDFGTGYSSLSYLHRFPINTIKIDRSFVSDMQPHSENAEIVRTIITLAHSLNLDVIAEGVETELQLAQLHWLACDQGQGFFFSPPIPGPLLSQTLRAKFIDHNPLRHLKSTPGYLWPNGSSPSRVDKLAEA
ncbi:EAL domain-containing protein [Synechocystis sp. LKSZ1]|uniref:EAL domain-containing protein n=1 Tax=Synechocystis sp. LKSZ1 TaxID=3144951 RepID=UPI00336BE248